MEHEFAMDCLMFVGICLCDLSFGWFFGLSTGLEAEL